MRLRAGPLLEAIRSRGDSSEWRRLVASGRAAYRVVDAPSASGETRGDVRRRTRLISAKILDGAGVFLCEALIQDRSASGLRLLLARNLGLPIRFGVHDDSSGEIVTASAIWRRERILGVRIVAQGPPTPLRAAARAALAGSYYSVRG